MEVAPAARHGMAKRLKSKVQSAAASVAHIRQELAIIKVVTHGLSGRSALNRATTKGQQAIDADHTAA